MIDANWLKPEFVAEQMKRGVFFACANKFKPSRKDKRSRTVCLQELHLGEDGLLHCPVHGKDICE